MNRLYQFPNEEGYFITKNGKVFFSGNDDIDEEISSCLEPMRNTYTEEQDELETISALKKLILKLKEVE